MDDHKKYLLDCCRDLTKKDCPCDYYKSHRELHCTIKELLDNSKLPKQLEFDFK